jgi:cytochrome P450
MEGVIVNLHGDPHLARRRLENRLFRRDTFAWYERHRIPTIVDAVIRTALADGRAELLTLARRTMMTLSIEVAGVDGVDTPEALARFEALMEALARASTVAHATGDKADIIDRGDTALERFEREFFRPSLARRQALVTAVASGAADPETLPRDVLTTLVVNQDRLELAPEVVLREVAYFPWVGSHSTSVELVHAMHHIFEWIAGTPPDRALLEHDDLVRQRFVHESLRLHPASPVAIRRATTDVVLKSGTAIAVGDEVVIDLDRANRDPDVFGREPDRFDPFRTIADGVAPWGLSFGHGTHACLGQELAGGLEPDPGIDQHLQGAVTLMAGALLRAGATPDRDDPPVRDDTTRRAIWGRYPVRFDDVR